MWSFSSNQINKCTIVIFYSRVERNACSNPRVPTIVRIRMRTNLDIRVPWLVPSTHHIMKQRMKNIASLSIWVNVWIFKTICFEHWKQRRRRSFPSGQIAPIHSMYLKHYAGTTPPRGEYLGGGVQHLRHKPVIFPLASSVKIKLVLRSG